MARRKKVWFYKPPRQPKPRVPESTKSEVEKRCNEFVDSILKPKYIEQHPKNERFNYIVDIFTKWYRNYFYFCAKYHSPGPNAIAPFFETKFARMEYVAEDQFNLSYMRHTGQWWELFSGLSLNECIEAINDMPHFTP
jgi:hypothetical protein